MVVIFAFCKGINVILIVVFADKPFGSNLRNTFQTISYVLTIILTFIAGIYYEIIYAPIKKYYTKIVESLLGKREVADVTILRTYNDILDKSGVKFKTIGVLEWSETQNDYVEREINLDANFDVDFSENQMVKFLVSGNILLGYEVK